jgi:hypothetical protein
MGVEGWWSRLVETQWPTAEMGACPSIPYAVGFGIQHTVAYTWLIHGPRS